jgi:ornithine carbamoyltransferase
VKDFLSVADLNHESFHSLLMDAIDLKNNGWLNALSHKILALTFEKPSLRTRVSFEVAMRQLGGMALYLSPAEVGMGQRESVPDVARVLSRMVHAIAARTFAHETLETMAEYADIPVINALSDMEHPCQALADVMTIFEKKGDLKKLTCAYIGDGNNVANSLMLACALTGMNFRIASPEGYTISDKYWKTAQDFAADSGSELFSTELPNAAAEGADVVYTDVWTSMGQESEDAVRRKVFANYQINAKLMKFAREDAIIMHPLPAHHGLEVEKGILDGHQSVVFDQAENRLHAQKAVLMKLLGGGEVPLARARR